MENGLKKCEQQLVAHNTDLLSFAINKALNVGTTLLFIKHVFHNWPGDREVDFRTNPANIALDRSFEYSMIDAFSQIQRIEIIFESNSVPFYVHGRTALNSRRDIRARPHYTEWTHKRAKKFYNKDLHIRDPRVLRLWGFCLLVLLALLTTI